MQQNLVRCHCPAAAAINSNLQSRPAATHLLHILQPQAIPSTAANASSAVGDISLKLTLAMMMPSSVMAVAPSPDSRRTALHRPCLRAGGACCRPAHSCKQCHAARGAGSDLALIKRKETRLQCGTCQQRSALQASPFLQAVPCSTGCASLYMLHAARGKLHCERTKGSWLTCHRGVQQAGEQQVLLSSCQYVAQCHPCCLRLVHGVSASMLFD
jgi:hypothetical protein